MTKGWNVWGMCVESRNRFPTLQTLYTSEFWTIRGEWGAQRSFDHQQIRWSPNSHSVPLTSFLLVLLGLMSSLEFFHFFPRYFYALKGNLFNIVIITIIILGERCVASIKVLALTPLNNPAIIIFPFDCFFIDGITTNDICIFDRCVM